MNVTVCVDRANHQGYMEWSRNNADLNSSNMCSLIQVYQTLGPGLQLLLQNRPLLHTAGRLKAGQEEGGDDGEVQERGGARRSPGAGEGEGPGERAREGGRQKCGELRFHFSVFSGTSLGTLVNVNV